MFLLLMVVLFLSFPPLPFGEEEMSRGETRNVTTSTSSLPAIFSFLLQVVNEKKFGQTKRMKSDCINSSCNKSKTNSGSVTISTVFDVCSANYTSINLDHLEFYTQIFFQPLREGILIGLVLDLWK
jgi:hypothetical protein